MIANVINGCVKFRIYKTVNQTRGVEYTDREKDRLAFKNVYLKL